MTAVLGAVAVLALGSACSPCACAAQASLAGERRLVEIVRGLTTTVDEAASLIKTWRRCWAL
ncbi:MAG: hypothetical protein ACLTMP_14765 [Eggerthella lenta]